MKRFRPCYLFENELDEYGLPGVSDQSNIMSLVMGASSLIDDFCGRIDGNGNGSLVYCTYVERNLLQARNRNLLRTMFKPLVTVTPDVASALQLSGGIGKFNNYWTGVKGNTILRPDLTLSPLLGASGRYGYPRRGEAAIYPDLNYGMNMLMVAAYFGGPPNFNIIDASSIDFDTQTGELWLPAGLYLSQYTEVVLIYNSGYDPTDMPEEIKSSCAAIVRNMLARGGGVTGLKSLSGQGMVNSTFTDDLIDPTVQRWLQKFTNIIAY